MGHFLCLDVAKKNDVLYGYSKNEKMAKCCFFVSAGKVFLRFILHFDSFLVHLHSDT